MDQPGCVLDFNRASSSDPATACVSTITEKISYPYDGLLDNLKSDCIILTPNRRLAASLLQRHQTIQRLKKIDCWETPSVLPMTTWIKQLWEATANQTPIDTSLLLTSTQASLLWEQILNQTAPDALLQMSETADIAQAAWRLLKQWNIPLSHPALGGNVDYTCMQTWATAFDELCDKQHWIDESSLPARLIDLIQQRSIALPSTIHLVGFTDIPPIIHRLLQACGSNACDVMHFKPVQQTNFIFRTTWEERDDELYAVARWAKSRLASSNDQSALPRIGCVIPGLDRLRDRIASVFTDVMGEGTEGVCFNLSAGKPLSHYPIIRSAFILLELTESTLPVDRFYNILNTPFCGEAECEHDRRARLDSVLRQRNQTHISMDDPLIAQITPRLHARLVELMQYVKSLPDAFTHEQVAEYIAICLKALGWPGERSLNSHEYQLVSRWMELLHEFCQLDLVDATTHFQSGIHRLKSLADKTIYQTETANTPIQIVGMLEAAGMCFDYLWVANLTDATWPPPPRPNPLLPKALQREHHMPHATAERELHFCRSIMSQFSECAGTIIYSYARKTDDIEQHGSPLIKQYIEIKDAEMGLSPFFPAWQIICSSKTLDYIQDEIAPPVTQPGEIGGGISLIRNQARCPFKAFAEHRLHARNLEEPVPGWRAYERGNMIHAILEFIWKKLGSQQALAALDEHAKQTLIDEAISNSLNSQSNSKRHLKRYNSLEQERLRRLMTAWLSLEMTRQPFQVIATEKKTQIELGSLVLDCKIDRIDRLDDQSNMIIDYKTGTKSNISGWFGNRPDEPQLPIYAISEDAISAIAYGQVNTIDLSLYGISRNPQDEGDIKAISTLKQTQEKTWDQQLDEWRLALTRLADHFCQGHAELDPKTAETCAQCSLHTFCRIQEEIQT